MITALDTNVLVALLGGTEEEARAARLSLSEAHGREALSVSTPVYAELIAAPGRGAEAIDDFLGRVRIGADWTLSEAVWHAAAKTFRG